MIDALTGEEKSALLLKNLAPEVVESILAELGSDRAARLRALMQSFDTKPGTQQALEHLLQELESVRTSPDEPAAKTAAPAPEPARPAPPRRTPPASDEGKLPPLHPEVLRAMESGKDPLQTLTQLPAQRLAMALEGENARTVSLLLNYLEVDLAGDVFKRLSGPLRNEVTLQFSNQATPRQDVLERVAQAILKKACALVEKPKFPEGPARFKKMADMLRLVDKPERLQLLKELDEKDPVASAQVKDYLYRFEDALRIEARSMQKLLMDVDGRSLALALHGADEAVKEKFMSCLSKRAKESLVDEMEMLQGVQDEQRLQAQKEVVAIIQRLDLSGELVMT